MNDRNSFKFFVSRGAVIYTAISTALIVIALFTAEDASVKILMPKRFLFLLLFSFILALGSTVVKLEKISATAARILHAICYIGGFALLLLLCEMKFAPLMIASLVFAIGYVIITLILTRSRNTSIKESKKAEKPIKKAKKSAYEYTPMFPSNNNSNGNEK